MEEIIFYILIFCIGCMFGSFFTLAVHRIPLHQDITHERSYCPNCNHKLAFLDLIPVLSYIFLGGKCRYCKQKIRIRYLLLEILTGIVFLLFAMSVNISFMPLKLEEIIYLVISLLYIAGLIIIAGIDKERREIRKGLFLYETIISSLYMVYLCIVEEANIYRYAIYLGVLAVFLIYENTYFKTKLRKNYIMEILELSMLMTIFQGEKVYVLTAILTLLSIGIERIIVAIKNIKHKENKKISYYINLKIGFYLIVCHIISILMVNFGML